MARTRQTIVRTLLIAIAAGGSQLGLLAQTRFGFQWTHVRPSASQAVAPPTVMYVTQEISAVIFSRGTAPSTF